MRLIFVAINNKYMGHGGDVVEWNRCRSKLLPPKKDDLLCDHRTRLPMEAVSCGGGAVMRAGKEGIEVVARSPEEAVEMMDKAFNEGDVDAILALYENSAVVVTEPGKVVSDRAELRRFFDQAVHGGLSAKQLKTYTLEADGVALFLSRWSLHRENGNVVATFVATTVFRKQLDGGWRALIDNPFGPVVLGDEQNGTG